MSERLTSDAISQQDAVGVYGSGKLVYVLMKSRDDFDKLALPLTDHGENENGHVLSKSLDADGVMVVFQHWLKWRTYEAVRADLDAERAAKAAAHERAVAAATGMLSMAGEVIEP